MKKGKEFVFKERNLLYECVFTAMFFLFIVWMIIKLSDRPLVLLVIGLVPCVMLYFQAYTIIVAKQFNKADYGKKIIISEDRSSLIFIQNNKKIEIKSDDVVRVEIYSQKNIGKFGTFNYLLIYTNMDSFLITQFTVPQLIYNRSLESFLSKKPRVYFKKLNNYIDNKLAS
ncbi:hypothetical protein GCM10023149_35790 [Mucilaginibacter gynuensis]|uniref:YcxB-like protein n=1 Tax=Mucilaginibacter gynuensis TaxID=1302236 RepID=A0ABP8GVP5_9SPHI